MTTGTIKSNLRVRIYEASCLTPEVENVRHETWMETYPNRKHKILRREVHLFLERNFLKVRENISAEERVFVAKNHGHIIGFCHIHTMGKRNRLNALYVLPSFQRQGVGGRLWNRALKYLDPSKDIILDVATYNKKAINFYRRLGFKDTGARGVNKWLIMNNGHTIPQMRMRIRRTPQKI